MKTIKLEVGNTYLSREGKEVRIIEHNGEGKYPYKGSNYQRYIENGRFNCYVESQYDLIEEVPETRHTFKIPDGVKEITLDYFGNRIVVEMVPEKEPKPGDVMINKDRSVYIFKEVLGKTTHEDYARLEEDGRLLIGGYCISGHPATPEEAQPLFDALKERGKKWNPETMQVEEIPESEQIMDYLQGYADDVIWDHKQVCWLIEHYLKHKEGEK